MGRAGGGGGGHSGGGHFSSHHSGGGHRVSSNSRSSNSFSGGRSSQNRSFNGNHNSENRTYVNVNNYSGRNRRYGSSYHGGGSGGSFGSMVGIIVFILLMIVILSMFSGISSSSDGKNGGITVSTYNREKLDSGYSFESDCIEDQVNWLQNEKKVGKELKEFYEKTGVQPYIVLLKENDEVKALNDEAKSSTNEEKIYADYAEQIFAQFAPNEATFMYIYFQDEENEKHGQDGYMYCVTGKQASAVMDSEARDIFWDYLDAHWFSDMTEDELFVETFNKTASRIMTITTTGKDVAKTVAIGSTIAIIAIVGGVAVVKIVKSNNKRKEKEAEERAKILTTPMSTLVDEELKETAKKYENMSDVTSDKGTSGDVSQMK